MTNTRRAMSSTRSSTKILRPKTNCGVKTRSKCPVLLDGLVDKKRDLPWIAATATRNYMMNDALVDYLKLYHRRSFRSPVPAHTKDSLNYYLLARGIIFEDQLIQYMKSKGVKCRTVSNIINDETVHKTIQYMKQGIPVIHSAPVRNRYNNTHGIVDLLVRSDYLATIVNQPPPTCEDTRCIRAPKLKGKYHYVVIDIKWSTLPLRSDGVHILNDTKFKAYKSQLWIYTKAVSHIQGYESQYAYIIGRRWRYYSKGERFSCTSCLDKLGVVDFKGKDSQYPKETNNAIKWLREVRKNGHKWSLYPPSRPELYPNMSQSGNWDGVKYEIAKRIGEITMIWNCGVRNREFARINNNITSWHDPNCSSETIGISGQRASIIDKIIEINRDSSDVVVKPKRIESSFQQWRDRINEVFVDFETMIDICSPMDELPEQRKTDMIFMIGVGYMKKGQYVYKSFIANSLTPSAEYTIMDNFYKFMVELGSPRMWFWHAEERFWSIAEKRQFNYHANTDPELDTDMFQKYSDPDILDHISDDWSNNMGDWCDLSVLFRSEPIVIKGCFGYSLKHIAHGLYSHGLIRTKIESECNNGNTAVVKAIKTYEQSSNPQDSPAMKDIELYNKFDCKVLYDILTYLRKHH